MTNTEIFQAYLWHIGLYSHKPEEQTVHDELIRLARKYIGLDIPNIRVDIHYQDVLVLILMDIHGQFNKCDWFGADKNFQLFDRIASGKEVKENLLFDRWYTASQFYFRRGFLKRALEATFQAEPYARGHFLRYKMLLLRGEIESAKKNMYEFSVNSLSSALYEAEQLGETYVIDVYNRLAHMFSMQYASLGMSFLRKAQALCERLGDEKLLLENRMARVNSYYGLSLRHPQDEKMFLDEAQQVLNLVDYDSLPLLQNKMFYKELLGKITHNVAPVIEACKFYQDVEALDEICRCCDTILVIGINFGQAAKALPYVEIYRKAAMKRNDKNLALELQYIQKAEDLIYGILGKQKK